MLNILDRRLHELYFLIQLQQKLGQTLSGSGINYYHSFSYVFADLLQNLCSKIQCSNVFMLYIYTDAKLKYDFVQTIVSLQQFYTDLRKLHIIIRNKIALQNVALE